jgi:DNA-binding NarL/FixJ family response regulator
MRNVVLLINPEPLQNYLLRQMFAEELPALELIVAEELEEGWRQVRSRRDRLALVITEKKFEVEDTHQISEEKSGIRFIAQLHQEFPEVPILVWTVDMAPGEARSAGAASCLGKSTEYDLLIAEVQKLLAGGPAS